ncbi:MAG: sigma 54-interacting transcriptional regulator, partial [Planctomycetota bacterium]|nr:sigma 54-interacting transcriptional regulator [Planctomycetota bacterium]
FTASGSNTACLQEALGLAKHPIAARLVEIARFDPKIAAADKSRAPDEDTQYWLDFITASIADYWKYDDSDSYANAIRCLARLERDEIGARLVRNHRAYGNRYIFHGCSQFVRNLRQLIRKAAETDENVLICGPTGVGKEHVAHLIFERSSRSTERLVPVNCADFAGNAGLANSALFGHVRGAFTGAVADRKGMFQEADGGVLFLDEVAELPLEVQGKLLRVLQDGLIRPEGADKANKVDVRVIAATNRDLPAMIRKGQFRLDLFYRLAEIRINIPPLAKRPQDIYAILDAKLAEWKQEGCGLELADQDRRRLRDYDWPGNVRQLLAVLKRVRSLDISVAEAIAEERALQMHEPDAQGEKGGLLPTCEADIKPIEHIDRLKRAYIKRCWKLLGKNSQRTAARLGIARNTLKAWLQSDD